MTAWAIAGLGLAAVLVLAWLAVVAANTARAQRLAPGLSALPLVKDHGYRIFRLSLSAPSEDRERLAGDCYTFAVEIAGTLRERPVWANARWLTPERLLLQRAIIRHRSKAEDLYAAASAFDATGREPWPPRAALPTTLAKLPRYFADLGKRLETCPEIAPVSGKLASEIPPGSSYIHLAARPQGRPLDGGKPGSPQPTPHNHQPHHSHPEENL